MMAKRVIVLFLVLGMILSICEGVYAYDSNEYEFRFLDDATYEVVGHIAHNYTIERAPTVNPYASEKERERQEIMRETWILMNGGEEVYTFFDYSVTIPSTNKGVEVTSVGDYAFAESDYLEKVTIPSSIINIGKGAFIACNDLETVDIDNGVKSIGIGVFSGCNSLTEIVIPDSVTEIGDSAFANCTKLKKVSLPANVTLGEGVFDGCNNCEVSYRTKSSSNDKDENNPAFSLEWFSDTDLYSYDASKDSFTYMGGFDFLTPENDFCYLDICIFGNEDGLTASPFFDVYYEPDVSRVTDKIVGFNCSTGDHKYSYNNMVHQSDTFSYVVIGESGKAFMKALAEADTSNLIFNLISESGKTVVIDNISEELYSPLREVANFALEKDIWKYINDPSGEWSKTIEEDYPIIIE